MTKYIFKILISFIALLLSLSIAECGLRMYGVKPGFKSESNFFFRVDSLYMLEGFQADSNGIFCISQKGRELICDAVGGKELNIHTVRDKFSEEIYAVAQDFIKIKKQDYRSDFKTLIDKVKRDSSDREFVNALNDYVKCPINSNGFKSIEFKRYKEKKKSILLLGDSFTWGHSASNVTNCFADLLLAKGYVVYNTGISGADPPQYLRLAQILVKRLEPDYVVVNFYMGNDIQYFKREIIPFMPLMYITNSGNLTSFPMGVYFESAQEAYKFSLADVTIPPLNNFNRYCSTTSLTTLLWRTLNKGESYAIFLPQYAAYLEKVEQAKMKTPYSNILIEKIKALSDLYNAKFFLVVIPKFDGEKFIFPSGEPNLFDGMEYFVPPVETKHYRQFADGHYNDLGHAIHAIFIDSLIANY